MCHNQRWSITKSVNKGQREILWRDDQEENHLKDTHSVRLLLLVGSPDHPADPWPYDHMTLTRLSQGHMTIFWPGGTRRSTYPELLWGVQPLNQANIDYNENEGGPVTWIPICRHTGTRGGGGALLLWSPILCLSSVMEASLSEGALLPLIGAHWLDNWWGHFLLPYWPLDLLKPGQKRL